MIEISLLQTVVIRMYVKKYNRYRKEAKLGKR